MTQTVFNMENNIEAVDPLVLVLKTAVEGVLRKEKLMRFEISVIEALTNVVEHAKADGNTLPVEIHLALEKNSASVVIFDQDGAPAFDPSEHAIDLELVDTMSEGGRGLGLILQCADRVEYGTLNGRNRIFMNFDNAV